MRQAFSMRRSRAAKRLNTHSTARRGKEPSVPLHIRIDFPVHVLEGVDAELDHLAVDAEEAHVVVVAELDQVVQAVGRPGRVLALHLWCVWRGFICRLRQKVRHWYNVSTG